MIFEGVIVSVMETWPLRLTVSSAAGAAGAPREVDLTLETRVSRDGEPCEPHALRPNQRVRIDGATTTGRIVADVIIVVGDEPASRPATPAAGQDRAQPQTSPPAARSTRSVAMPPPRPRGQDGD